MQTDLHLLRAKYWPSGQPRSEIPNAPARQWEDEPQPEPQLDAYETPRLFATAEESFKALIVFLSLGVGARIAAGATPPWFRLAVTTLAFWGVACGCLFVGVLLWQTAEKTWKRGGR